MRFYPNGTSGRETACGKFRESMIENQRVLVRNEQGESGFRSDDMRRHRGALGERDIGRIADQPFYGGQGLPRVAIEKVELMERYIGV